jgi:defect-in-organelle-trafficking protein DotA
MANIFQLASNDQSVYFLGQIFGNVGVALSGTGPLVLGKMFEVLNTALLAIGALMVAYTTIVGVLKTAGEGQFLGQKWDSLWVPLRMVMGIAALMPTGSGYCAIQIVMMWVVVQGVGAADNYRHL